jgi:hypothetical protein
LVKDPIHVIQCSNPFIVLYFENRNWPVARLKWLSFFSWFFVSTLNSNFGYIFCWSVMRWYFFEFEKQDAQALLRNVVSFLNIYFINMHNNQKLNSWSHDPYRKALLVLRAPFIDSNCLLDQKGLLNASNAGYSSWLWKKGKFTSSKRCLRVSRI